MITIRGIHSVRRAILTLAAACILFTSLSGCEEDVLVAENTTRPFSLYGVFSPELDTQWVRVYAIEDKLSPILPAPLAATFTTKDLQTNTILMWSDSLIQETDGSWAHVFWSPFQADYGHTYEVTVATLGESSSHADIAVPPRTEMVILDPAPFPPVHERLPVQVQGGAPRIMNVELVYAIKFADGPPEETTSNIVLPYSGREENDEGGWIIPINMSRDRGTITQVLQREPLWTPSYGIRLLGMTLRLIIASEDWNPPGGTLDPEVLVEPGLLSNIDNGFGFVGAGYHLSMMWLPPESTLTAAGFRIQ